MQHSAQQSEAVTIAGRLVTYTVRRSKRARRLQVRAEVERGIEVVVPERMRSVDAGAFLVRHGSWVLAQIARLESLEHRRFPSSLDHGGSVLLFGKGCPVVLRYRGRRAVARYHDGRIHVDVPAQTGKPVVRAAIQRLMKRIAREAVTARVRFWCAELGLAHGRIQVRSQRTLWGSCTEDGHLSFNWRLVLAPPEILDYVVAHEVAHLVHLHHGHAFWSTVAGMVPDWRRCERWLDDHGETLVGP